MIVKLWNNLVKFLLLRSAAGLAALLHSGYCLCISMLRKANRRFIRFSWLRSLINRLLPCPQMVQRFINPALGIQEFFAVLNERGVRYSVLRGFDELPKLRPGDDIDMLVHDDDLGKIKDLFVVLPTGVSCDIYSVSALPGTSYLKGVPLYPSQLAREILDTSVMHKGTFRVPDPKRHFLSLAYHVVYHKPEASGLAPAKHEPAANLHGARSYADKLLQLAESIGIKAHADLQSLRELLSEHGWAPRIDVLRRLAKGSKWLTALAADPVGASCRPANMLSYSFDVHGVRVLVETNCAAFMDYVERDFCFFHTQNEKLAPPHVHMNFLKTSPPWEEIPRAALPIYKTAASTVYRQGPNRYVDHGREVLAVYDLKRDQGTVYGTDSDAMYRIAYAMLMTRIGLRLDAIRRHRMHALAISVNDLALLFLGDGGCGKSTLGLEMMKHKQVGWLTDDILPVEADGRALAFPTSPRLMAGSIIPWLPPSVKLLPSPMPKQPPKVQLPASSILPRVCASAKLGALFLCSREPGVGPSIRRVGFFAALRGMCANAFTGKEFGHMLAYHLQFSPVYLFNMAAMYLSRLRTFAILAGSVPVFRFEMGGDVAENAALILQMYSSTAPHKVAEMVNAFSPVSSVESGEPKAKMAAGLRQ